MAKVELVEVADSISILEALKVMNRAARGGGPTGIVVVVDRDRALMGVVTDGDVRRALTNGVSLDAAVSTIMVRDPISVRAGQDPVEMMRVMLAQVKASGRIRDTKVDQLLVIDDASRPVDVVGLVDLVRESDSRFRTVSVVGLGFVGLTLAVSLAECGFLVRGIEKNPDTRTKLRAGEPHFHEVGLPPLLRHHVGKGTLVIAEGHEAGAADVYIITVGTPVGADHKPRLDDVRAAAAEIGACLKKGDLVVLRSTVPVSTCREVVAPVLTERSGLTMGVDYSLAFAPERTVEGRALEECRTIPQIIGGVDDTSVRRAAALFQNLTATVVRVSSLEAAEMAKLVNNTYRDFRFSFANELALVRDRMNLDAVEVIQAANEGYPRDPVPLPSPGVGGPCLTKDPHIFAASAEKYGGTADLARTGRRVHEKMPLHMAEKIRRFMHREGKDPRTGRLFILGLAFKGEPETSDTRDAPALDLIRHEKGNWREIVAYDAIVNDADFRRLEVGRVSREEGFQGADVAVVMNNHASLKQIDLFKVLPSMRGPAFFLDGWKLFSRRDVESVPGISYGNLSQG